jgi:mannose-6-phosphate isomerase-like protein (cupin superfamily)
MKAGKIWGETETIVANGVFEAHRIETRKGTRCSMHKHEFKWNGFFVESGRLRIVVRKTDYNNVDMTELGPGEYCQVKPGEFHRFEAIEDSVAFEFYWAEFNHNDIEREDVGGAISPMSVRASSES